MLFVWLRLYSVADVFVRVQFLNWYLNLVDERNEGAMAAVFQNGLMDNEGERRSGRWQKSWSCGCVDPHSYID